MFWKVLEWIKFVISVIAEAETKLGPKTGEAKKAFVLEHASREYQAMGLPLEPAVCDAAAVGSHVGAVIDGAVGLLNCLGVFRRSPATSPQVDTADELKPPEPSTGS